MMTAKFNSLFRAVALTATLALALPVFGQATQTRVNIPLAFEMGHESMPAGDYILERNTTASQVLITNPSGVKRVYMAFPVGSNQTPFHGKLVFERMGATYRLAEVYLTGAPHGMRIPATKEQIELAKVQRPVRIEVAMASR